MTNFLNRKDVIKIAIVIVTYKALNGIIKIIESV